MLILDQNSLQICLQDKKALIVPYFVPPPHLTLTLCAEVAYQAHHWSP